MINDDLAQDYCHLVIFEYHPCYRTILSCGFLPRNSHKIRARAVQGFVI
jgi:hypothetical protein